MTVRIVIIGGGQAGGWAAKTLRDEGFDVNPLSASCASLGVMAGVPSSFLASSKACKMAALYSSIVIIIFMSFR